MSYKDLPVGSNPPTDVNVIIEVPMNGTPAKYEMDKTTGMILVDRFLNVSMRYPGNYGFIPHTLSEDGDPLDVLVVERTEIMSGAVVAVRPIGVLIMEDESGMDEKIIAVPVDRLNPYYGDVREYTDLRKERRQEIEHFFEHYKDLEHGKWVKIHAAKGAKDAERVIEEAIARAKAALPESSNDAKPKSAVNKP